MDYYKFISASTVAEFEDRVNGCLQGGYVPYGQPVVSGQPPRYFQAMTYTQRKPDNAVTDAD